jgi:hypothetical protein
MTTKTIPDPLTLEEELAWIAREAELPIDWDEEGGLPSTNEAVEVAAAMHSELRRRLEPRLGRYFYLNGVCALGDGGLLLSWAAYELGADVILARDAQRFNVVLADGDRPLLSKVVASQTLDDRGDVVEVVAAFLNR